MAPRNIQQKQKSIIELIESGIKDKASFSAEEYYNELKRVTEQYENVNKSALNMKKIISHLNKGIKNINSGLSLLQGTEDTQKDTGTAEEANDSMENDTK